MSSPTTAFNFEFIGDFIRPNYQTLPKDIRVGLYILKRGVFSYLNACSCRILGIATGDELKGQSFWQMIHPEDRHLVKLHHKANTKALKDPMPFRMFKADGTAIWVAMQGRNTTIDGQRANMGYLIDMRSIRYLKRALEKYRARITLVEDVVAELDLKGNIRSYTQAAYQMWGIKGDEMVGKSYRDFMDKTSADIVRQAYTKVYETGEPCSNIIYEILRKDGRRLVVEDSVALTRDSSGHPNGFLMVSRDITRLKETEQESAEYSAHLEAIFRSVHDGVITVDPNLEIIDANVATCNICGVDLNKAAGEHLPDLIQNCSAMCCKVLQQTLTDRVNIDNHLIECKHEQNPQQVVNVSSAALMSPDDKFLGAVLVIRDVTRLHDLERALKPRDQYQDLIGKNKKMQEIYALVEDLADLDTTVLVTGESGTGKNLIAKALHASGRRTDGPFVTVNCSALAESLLESELFGHAKGAFTGAIANKKGRFESAQSGTILLDEIGDISQLIQLKLLRVLQEKEIERVGESEPRKVDVRVIACTNKDLMERVQSGEFREDLYYRLKVIEIKMPPLRERTDDIPLLIEQFSTTLNKRFKKTIKGVSNDALAKLMDYNWPGNVRELEHTMERAFILCNEPQIKAKHLPSEIRNYKPQRVKKPAVEKDPAQEIRQALDDAFWNRSQAAQILGISRQTLYRKMKAYNLINKN